MKIGLVTTYRIDNYGTKLQAYAMQTILQAKSDEVCLIDYYSSFDMRFHVVVAKIYKKVRSLFDRKNGKDRKVCSEYMEKRHAAISSFDKYYDLSPAIRGYANLKAIVGSYDCFVCGSDQIWAESNNVTDFFNLNFVAGKKPTVAYAPSFGTSQITKPMRKAYREYLRRINFISVRENSGVGIIKQLIGRDVQQVLDPTLLVDKEMWEGLIKEDGCKTTGQKYIFCYFLGRNPSHRKFVSHLSRQTGLEVVNIAHMKGFCPADESLAGQKLYDVSPPMFLNLIKNAQYVCTDSFHGTVFSIIFGKNFYTFERFISTCQESTNSRIYSLLDMFGLEGRIIKADEISFKGLTTIDYGTVYRKLHEERGRSLDFLYSALEKIRRNENNR